MTGGRTGTTTKHPSILLDPVNYQESFNFYLKTNLSFYLPSLLKESWGKKKKNKPKQVPPKHSDTGGKEPANVN